MIFHWIVLLYCIVGALCAAPVQIGKLPRINRPRPSLGIFGSKNTTVEKYPCLGSLTQSIDFAGAVIILKKNWLLTTAFNVDEIPMNSLKFRLGSDFYDKGGQLHTAKAVFVHPNYTGSWDWDIALIKTSKPIKMGKKVKPATLVTTRPPSGTKGPVAGWGQYDSTCTPSEVMRDGLVTKIDWKKCQETYGRELTERLYCTWDKRVSPCFYDFSDPHAMLNDSCVIIGMFAGGYGCTPNAKPVLYTDVVPFKEWIEKTIKNNEDDELE